jgi:hypothetical protein
MMSGGGDDDVCCFGLFSVALVEDLRSSTFCLSDVECVKSRRIEELTFALPVFAYSPNRAL